MYMIRSLKGPLKGQIFPIDGNLKLGRRQGDIVLKDPAASDPHGEIRVDSRGRILLKDLKSKNGIFTDGRKKDKIVLKENTKFKIGKSEFQVLVERSAEEIWTDILKDSLTRVADRPVALSLFPKPLNVEFLSGPQSGMKFCLTYGPRYFGSSCMDMPLLDPTAPEKSFTLHPEKEGVLFVTDFPKSVRLNGEEIKKTVLKEKDCVWIGDTKIQFTFYTHTSSGEES